MTFPESPRVLFELNPLVEVVCQLSFPSVLRIDSQSPAAFQDRVRAAFPVFVRQVVSPVQGLVPVELANLIGGGVASYQFASEDEQWRLTLSRDFLALSTSKYVDWADFKTRLQQPVAALLGEYQPAFFQRIGLRYRDVIVRSVLGLQDVAWSDLVRPEIAGELGSELAPEIVRTLRELIVDLPENIGKVRMVHGLADRDPGGEQCYQIDCDFFTERRTSTNETLQILDAFNGRAGSLFRWCIQRRLHDALRPRNGQHSEAV
jgi:uncharacterized protein (TIGR04255 family)